MSVSEFLDWEERQPLRHEFDGVRPIAMTGGTAAHAAIQRNIAVAMTLRLRGKPCAFYGGDLKVRIDGRIRYPDGFVLCSPIDLKDKVVTAPVVIFEVISDTTWRTDAFIKNREYAATPSVRRYMLLSQDDIGGTMFERAGQDWIGHVLEPEAVIDMPEIELAVPVAEFYDGIAFPVLPEAKQ